MELIDFPLDRVQGGQSFDLEQLSQTLLDVSVLLIESKGKGSRRERDQSVDLAVQAMQLAAAVIERQTEVPARPRNATMGRCIQLVSEQPIT
jgi:hypothetical protein